METKYSYTFKSGATLTNVTFEQLIKFASSLKEDIDASKLKGDIPRGYYISKTKGLILIKDMESTHIANTLLKLAQEHFSNLKPTIYPILQLEPFLEGFVGLTSNTLINDLFSELTLRLK